MKNSVAIAFFFLATALVTGCAHRSDRGYDSSDPACAKEAGGVAWHHPKKTGSEFRAEEMSCRSEASSKAEQAGRPGNPFMIADETRSCLQKQYGWLPGCD